MSYLFINTSDTLKSYCEDAHKLLTAGDFLTIDTEFIREKTYAAQLCLIQVSTKDQAAIIDPLAPHINLAPLFDLLKDPACKVVFHAGRQDLEIFLAFMKELPTNVFDTQVAAMVCGFGDSAGYETLVKKICKAGLDKSARFSNWAQRPLSKRQLDYAIGDVTYLRDIYTFLVKDIKKQDRESWIQEEMQDLINPQTYIPNPQKLLHKIKLRTSKPHVLARAIALVNWREDQAARTDKPRQMVMRDDIIAELATQNPASYEDLKRTRGLKEGHLRSNMSAIILETLKKASSLPVDECPQLPAPTNEASVNTLTLEALKLILKYTAEKNAVAEKIIASVKDLSTLVRHKEEADLPCLSGWRRACFGETALDFLNGHLSLRLQDRALVLIKN